MKRILRTHSGKNSIDFIGDFFDDLMNHLYLTFRGGQSIVRKLRPSYQQIGGMKMAINASQSENDLTYSLSWSKGKGFSDFEMRRSLSWSYDHWGSFAFKPQTKERVGNAENDAFEFDI